MRGPPDGRGRITRWTPGCPGPSTCRRRAGCRRSRRIPSRSARPGCAAACPGRVRRRRPGTPVSDGRRWRPRYWPRPGKAGHSRGRPAPSPPIISTNRLVMAVPSPAPWTLAAALFCARVKGSKSRGEIVLAYPDAVVTDLEGIDAAAFAGVPGGGRPSRASEAVSQIIPPRGDVFYGVPDDVHQGLGQAAAVPAHFVVLQAVRGADVVTHTEQELRPGPAGLVRPTFFRPRVMASRWSAARWSTGTVRSCTRSRPGHAPPVCGGTAPPLRRRRRRSRAGTRW